MEFGVQWCHFGKSQIKYNKIFVKLISNGFEERTRIAGKPKYQLVTKFSLESDYTKDLPFLKTRTDVEQVDLS